MGQPSHNTQIQLAELMNDNLEKSQRIRALLPSMGVQPDAAREQGLTLVAAAKQRIADQDDREREAKELREDLRIEHDKHWPIFEEQFELAETKVKAAYLRDTLGLNAKPAHGRPAQRNQMRTFYSQALLSTAAQAELASVSVTRQVLEQGSAAVATIDQIERDAIRAEAAQVEATRLQKEALDALHEWRMDLFKRIMLGSDNDPELRKALGM